MRVESERKEEAAEGKKGGRTRNHSGEEQQMTERDQEMVSQYMGKGKDQKGLFKGGEYWEVEEGTRQTRMEKGSGAGWVQLPPNMGAGGSHFQATLDSKEEEEEQRHEQQVEKDKA